MQLPPYHHRLPRMIRALIVYLNTQFSVRHSRTVSTRLGLLSVWRKDHSSRYAISRYVRGHAEFRGRLGRNQVKKLRCHREGISRMGFCARNLEGGVPTVHGCGSAEAVLGAGVSGGVCLPRRFPISGPCRSICPCAMLCDFCL